MLEVGKQTRVYLFMMKVVISWRKKSTSSKKKRFVVVMFPVWDIAGLEDLSPILKHASPVVPGEVELPLLRTVIPSSEEDSLQSSHCLSSVTMSPSSLDEAEVCVLLMNICLTIGMVEEEMNLSLSLPDDQERLQGIMSQVPVRSLEGWRG